MKKSYSLSFEKMFIHSIIDAWQGSEYASAVENLFNVIKERCHTEGKYIYDIDRSFFVFFFGNLKQFFFLSDMTIFH